MSDKDIYLMSVLPKSFIEKAEELARKRLIRLFKEIGDECVDEAVSNGSYTDNTGNLRSSIGYVVARDGQVVEEGGFWNVGGPDGPDIGRSLAYRLATGKSGISLILVAGMEYAEYVSDRGYNVLDSAKILARQLVSQLKS